MLTDGKADSVKIHILDNKLFAELLCYVSRKLHINAVVILALGVLKRLESGVGSNYKLIFALVESCGLDCNGSAVAEVVVADLIKSAVGLDLLEDLVDLCKQLGLSLINAECILFIGKIIFDDLNFLCCGSGGSLGGCAVTCGSGGGFIVLFTAASCESGNCYGDCHNDRKYFE